MNLHLVLYVVAAVLFALAFFGVGGKFSLVAGGLFCVTLTHLI